MYTYLWDTIKSPYSELLVYTPHPFIPLPHNPQFQ